ncbi:MAG: MFS transporter [Clostridia bacterium]|nr:MFS transporter [Clostridia bacterium]
MKRPYIPGVDRYTFRRMLKSFSDIYGIRDDQAKGRLISLGSALMTAFYNVFITGIFYTGFLSMYDISITGVGIISFIPLITNVFSIFSSLVLERFKKRKWICLAAKVYFYAMYIIATTLMPQFVTDPDARLTWFIVLVFLAYAVYAIFSPGITAWFYKFYPADNERRTRYITLNQIFSSVMSSAILLLSGVLTDAVAGSAHQETVILAMRYVAFVMVLIDVGMQACAKEYPYPEAQKPKILDVFRLPFRYKKFLKCMLFMFFWNYVSYINNGLWGYHLLNHMHFSYTLINTISVMYTFILIFTANIWKKVLRRYSWIKTFGMTVFFWVPTEIIFFFMATKTTWIYVPMCTVQNILSVGLNLSYANVLYMNLPEENANTHIAFHTIGCNVCAFLGLLTGTWVSGITGDTSIMLWGIEVYSVQYTVLIRAVLLFIVAMVTTFKWKSFTRDDDIEDVETQAAVRKKIKEAKRAAKLQMKRKKAGS